MKKTTNIFNSFFVLTETIGDITLLAVKALIKLFTKKPRLGLWIKQMNILGVKSLPIVVITGFFSGMVMAYQVTLQMRKFGAEVYVGGITALSLARELAPVFTALMVAGRVSAGITAEIGSMRVTEQIDAMETLAVNPIEYLIVPRIIATLIMLPFLTVFADVIGYIGAYIIGVISLDINSALFIDKTISLLTVKDIMTGIVKSYFFAFIISLIGCYFGYTTKGGASGVGKAALMSVVTSCILIFIVDFILTAFFYSV